METHDIKAEKNCWGRQKGPGSGGGVEEDNGREHLVRANYKDTCVIKMLLFYVLTLKD